MPLRTMKQAMHEWKHGGIHMGKTGKLVPPTKKGQKIAQAIFYSEKRRMK